MASYSLSEQAVAHARELIEARQRTGLVACVYRAAQWRHKKVELAAHELLQQLDATSGS